MKVLTSADMELLSDIQDKYRFRDTFQLEATDVYDFCKSIKEAYYLGLHIEFEDLEFIDRILNESCE